MTVTLRFVLLSVGAYLLGSIPFGLIVGRFRGVDIRRHGSGNVGATNVGRVLGRKWGALVFLLDAGKGAASTIAAGLVAGMNSAMTAADSLAADWYWLGAGLACVAGAIAPIYLRFRGGKGVAASVGAILGIYPYLTLPALAVLVLWAAVVKISGYVSLGSIVAALALPIAFVAAARAQGWKVADHYPLLGLCLTLSAMILIRHRENMGRLMAGTEHRIGAARSSTISPATDNR